MKVPKDKLLEIIAEEVAAAREQLKKVQQDIDATHEQFKNHILKYRPDVKIKKVATGEWWLAEQAVV